MKALGRHFLLECYDCEVDILNDVYHIEKYMNEAAEAACATIIKSVFHPFFPHGISGVVVISESHLTIHTWPEYRYAAIDIFTCGNQAEPERACSYLIEKLSAKNSHLMEIKRGKVKQDTNELFFSTPSKKIRTRNI